MRARITTSSGNAGKAPDVRQNDAINMLLQAFSAWPHRERRYRDPTRTLPDANLPPTITVIQMMGERGRSVDQLFEDDDEVDPSADKCINGILHDRYSFAAMVAQAYGCVVDFEVGECPVAMPEGN